MLKRSAVALILTTCVATFAFGHEGKVHVMGTVTKLSANQVTVKTVDGKTTTILLKKDTKYLKGEKGNSAASASDLKVGQRVVIDVTGQGQKATAIEIRLGIQGMDRGVKPNAPRP